MNDASDYLPVGKLDIELLSELLEGLVDEDVDDAVIGPGVGEDVAVIDTGNDEYLLLKSDPITFATAEIGHYAVTVNVNDIATAGGTPDWLLATVLLPEGETTTELVRSVFGQLQTACERYNIQLVGGHTEVTHGLDRPIVSIGLVGRVPRQRLVTSNGIQVGDDILLTKAVAVEGTSIIAREKRAELLASGFDVGLIDDAANMLHEPGIGVLEEARIACDVADIHAMHDPTEGGLATGLWEMAMAGDVGLIVGRDDILVYANTQRFCEQFSLNPLGVIASGSLLIATGPDQSQQVIDACGSRDIRCTRIGRATDRPGDCRLIDADGERQLPRYDQDEIGKLF